MNQSREIERIDSQWDKIDGTHLQGHLNASYEEIVSVLGQPTHPVEKVDASWDFEIDSVVVTLYNWKDGQNYNGPTAPPVEELRSWSIGGHDSKAVEAVAKLFANSKIAFSN
tara:strand:- start:69 stop:404 length:336 start_codon:yes stop_codon:yes gene_type:complete